MHHQRGTVDSGRIQDIEYVPSYPAGGTPPSARRQLNKDPLSFEPLDQILYSLNGQGEPGGCVLSGDHRILKEKFHDIA